MRGGLLSTALGDRHGQAKRDVVKCRLPLRGETVPGAVLQVTVLAVPNQINRRTRDFLGGNRLGLA